MYAKAEKPEDLEPLKGMLAGKILLTTEPARVGEARPAQNAADALRGERGRDDVNLPYEARQRLRRQLSELIKKEGVAAILRESSKEHGLLNMTGVGGNNYQIGPTPTVFVIHEDYARLWRLLQRKAPVEVEIDIRNEIAPGPVEVYNTVAEIRGSEKPEEIVLVGAHLDSWDLGAGATDNATGSAVTLEAARAIQASGLRPKRTIRFALFTGEEQGLVGSREYIKTHKEELDRMQGVVIHDTGTGRVKSFTLEGRYDIREAMDKIVEPVREVGLEELSMRRTSGSDHVPFRDAGVPAFFGIQDPAEYRKTHHSQSDTFDKLRKEDLVQGAKVVAAMAWNLAEYGEKLPRKAPAPSRGTGSSP
jgi:Iap family predicted aminopeptidase